MIIKSKSLDVWNQMDNSMSIKYLSSASESEMAAMSIVDYYVECLSCVLEIEMAAIIIVG
jgi:hypothetical protein